MSDETNEFESLKRENDALRERLAKSQFETEMYRNAAYAMLQELEPEIPLTDEEIQESMTAPRGQPLVEIIEEYERELRG